MKRSVALLLVLAILAGGGAAWRIANLAAREQAQLVAERERAARLRQQLEDADRQASLGASSTTERPEDTATSAATPRTEPPSPPSHEQQVADWLARVKRLKSSFKLSPDQAIPELGLLTDLEWVALARTLGSDAAELSLRRARSEARSQATKKFLQLLRPVLDEFRQANQRLPEDLAELVPHLRPPLDTAMLARYELLVRGPVRPMMRDVLAERAPVDLELDERYALTFNGSSGGRWAYAFLAIPVQTALEEAISANRAKSPARGFDQADLLPFIKDPIAHEIFSAQVSYRREHGKESTDPAELRPYVSSPAGLAALETMIRAHQLRR